MTKTTVTAGIAILTVIAATMILKAQSPQVKDSFFNPDEAQLRQVPKNLCVLRPTHFPLASSEIRHVHDQNDDSTTRILGRDVSLQQVIAEAYDCKPSRVILPSEAPKDGFDFVVTTARPRIQLQTAIRKQLGYAAHAETRDTEVLRLKVGNPALPGLTESPDSEKATIYYKDGKLHFQHQQLTVLLNGLSSGLKQPVLDQTGLTNCYDFSVAWTDASQQRMQKGEFSLDGVQKVMAGWGLRLESGTEPLEMFIVDKTR